MRSIIPFDIEYYRDINTLILIQSNTVMYEYSLRNHTGRTTCGTVKFYERTCDSLWNLKFSNYISNYNYLELTPKESRLIRSMKHYV